MCSRRLVHWYIVRKLDKTFWTCSSQWGTGTLVPCNSDNRMRREYQYVITIIIIAPCNIGKKSEITTRTHDMGKYGWGAIARISDIWSQARYQILYHM